MKVYQVTIPETYTKVHAIPVLNPFTQRLEHEEKTIEAKSEPWDYRVPLVDIRHELYPYVYECYQSSGLNQKTNELDIRDEVNRWYEKFVAINERFAAVQQKDELSRLYWEDTCFIGKIMPGRSMFFREDIFEAIGGNVKDDPTNSFPSYAIVKEIDPNFPDDEEDELPKTRGERELAPVKLDAPTILTQDQKIMSDKLKAMTYKELKEIANRYDIRSVAVKRSTIEDAILNLEPDELK
jgi:hypothetical protein